MSIGLALIFGILYWLATNKLWYGALHLTRQPLVLAVPIGIIMGDVPTAIDHWCIFTDDLSGRYCSRRNTSF